MKKNAHSKAIYFWGFPAGDSPGKGTLLLVSFFLLVVLSVAGQRTDKVQLENGDVITGEIKRMNLGLLEYSVDDIQGRINVKWEHIVRLTSDQELDVELKDGTVHLGTLIEAPDERLIRVKTEDGEIDIPILEVTFIKPIKQKFWKNLDGSISMGLSFTKSTDLLQFSFGSGVSYRSLRTLNDLSLNTIISAQRDQAAKTNTDLQFVHLFFLKKRWYLQGVLGGTRNDELGINLRAALSAGGGNRIIRTSRIQFLVAGLLSGNIENRNDGTRINNLESVVEATFMFYDYDTPRLEIKADVASFFSLTSLGRVRLESDLRLSLEIIKDLYWDISQFYFRYDSDPSLAASSRTDFGFVTNIRYRFGRGTFED